MNAYYDPLDNQITFPAAILQPPFFDPNADPAANYGAIGAVIGHEIGHGFDDQGRQFDATGQIRDWWTPAAAKAYTERTESSVKQYDGYEPIAGTAHQRQADDGREYRRSGRARNGLRRLSPHVAMHGEPPVIDGLTGDQRFFIAYGSAWQSKRREAAMRQRLLTDPHSPRQISRQRRRPQRRRLVQGVQHPAWRQALSAARTARAHLVIARRTKPRSSLSTRPGLAADNDVVARQLDSPPCRTACAAPACRGRRRRPRRCPNSP